jgi:hypothetical protein
MFKFVAGAPLNIKISENLLMDVFKLNDEVDKLLGREKDDID